jgi:hypothetical protein
MILSDEQACEIIRNNPNKALIETGRNYNKRLRTHFYGEDLKDYAMMATIDGYENPPFVNYVSSTPAAIVTCSPAFPDQ